MLTATLAGTPKLSDSSKAKPAIDRTNDQMKHDNNDNNNRDDRLLVVDETEEEERLRLASRGQFRVWSMGRLCDVVEATSVCVMQPVKYFVAWQGVLTIAYSGIPPSIVQLKKRIGAEFPAIKREKPGSLWPKTSLACLHDRRYLSFSQLLELHHICSEESSSLVVSPYVLLNNLSVVLYENCCLEKTMLETRVPLQYPADLLEPAPEERTFVEKVLNDFSADNLEKYMADVSADGNRSTHYKSSMTGVSLVHFIAKPPPSLARFKQRVESTLPGLYDWFSEPSLHITIRSLI